MDGLELNKIACAILFSVLIIMGINIGVNEFKHTSHHTVDKHNNGLIYIPEGFQPNTNTISKIDTNKKTNLEPIENLLVSADAQAGKKVSKKCLQCHTFEQNGKTKLGPNLWGVIGRKIAGLTQYSYSKALSSKNNESWNIENLNKFLYKPREFAKGTKMSFAGLKKPQDRANIIAYIISNKN